MKKNSNTILVSGLALFSMFFGAGNLIFPPTLGMQAGSSYIQATLGFLISSVGIVLLAVIASAKAGGSIKNLAAKLNSKFAFAFETIILLAIGPILAIPRTAATTYEIIHGTTIPNLNPILSAVIFFTVVVFFVLNPANIIDNLGKILTPALIVVLAMIIIKGFTSPLGEIVNTGKTGVFGYGFERGYQTMDALAALVFTSIIIKNFAEKGITNKKDIVKNTVYASLIAAVGLSIVYSGLLYIGATTSGLGVENMETVELLIYATTGLLGTFGKYALSIAIALACLTTAIGLSSTVVEYFYKLSKGKIKKVYILIISTLFSGYISISGVDNIVAVAGDLLSILYPVAIVLVFLNLFSGFFTKRATYIGSVFGTLIPTIIVTISEKFNISLGVFSEFLINFKNSCPTLYTFKWIIPAIVFGFLFTVFSKEKA